MPTPPDKLITQAEAAAILGVSSATVSRMGRGEHAVKLERIKVGRDFYLSRRQAEAARRKILREREQRAKTVQEPTKATAPATAPASAPAAPAGPTVTQADRVDEMRAALMQELRKAEGKADYLIGLVRAVAEQTNMNTTMLRNLGTMQDATTTQTEWNTTVARRIAAELGVAL